MASGVTRISDVIVPEIFTPYVQQITTQKSRVVRSGLLQASDLLSTLLAGGGLTFNVPGWKDLDDDTENVSSDDPSTLSSPNKIGSAMEIAVRMNRNNSWSSMDLTAQLAGEDPMEAIANRVGAYWARRLQVATLAVIAGVFADNAAAPAGTEHVQNDMIYDIKGASYSAGVTDFSAEAFIDAAATMGDSMDDLVAMACHSIVYNRMQKNNLIDFIPDAEGRINIPTFLGREVIVDDGLTAVSSGVYNTFLFGRGALQFGQAEPPVATETARVENAGNGSGQDVLHNRVQWCIHPVGHKFAVASPANGGPSNASTSGNLAHASSWERVYAERKMIKLAKLVTRES
jgi:hypothetical protein